MTIYASCAVLLEESVSAMINPLTPTNTTLQLAVTMGDYPRSNIVCCRRSSIFEKIINPSIFGQSTLPQHPKNPNDS